MTLSAARMPEGLEMNTQRISENRKYHALRAHIDKMLAEGWSITGRDPVRLERAPRVLIVRGRALING